MDSIRLVSFGFTTIQKLRRITLDHNLLQNLSMKEGDTVQLFLDTDKGAIVVKKPSVKAEARAVAQRQRKR